MAPDPRKSVLGFDLVVELAGRIDVNISSNNYLATNVVALTIGMANGAEGMGLSEYRFTLPLSSKLNLTTSWCRVTAISDMDSAALSVFAEP